MKVDLDARTLEAMRFLANARGVEHDGDLNVARVTVRAFIAAHDSARDAERDEALAVALDAAAENVYVQHFPDEVWTPFDLQHKHIRDMRLAQARAARDFIAKEQGQ